MQEREAERAEWEHQKKLAELAMAEAPKKRGRAPKYATEEERKDAQKKQRQAYKEKINGKKKGEEEGAGDGHDGPDGDGDASQMDWAIVPF